MHSIISISCALLATLQLANAAPAPQASSAAVQVSVSYDEAYDVKGASLTSVSCSTGENGLIDKGFSTFESLPTFPLIGGAPTIKNWNDPNCGKCYQLRYQSGKVDNTINVLAIDSAPGGFNLALQAMDRLTNNQGKQLGRVTATYTEAPASECGL
ncbi:hypothetical protein N7492_005471 [Penicillium capsulatum]|uniref:Allergen Asp f 15 n=1 Tax=Penicillium capsulatum TaxID=69766 RepID=A0A9W9IC08_9EURO|nr:hypothetical protein N7492_005471 [Penicillium capsulatum]KAJ6135428.1 hypothetical protein N7512_000588 [Penicillium capsulatum]